MSTFKRIAIAAIALVSFVGVEPAFAQGCSGEIRGTYGTLTYGQHSITRSSKGDIKVMLCGGVFVTLNGGKAIEASNFFVDQNQINWFKSDLSFEAVSFYPDDSGMGDGGFTLYPSQKDFTIRPTNLLLRSPDSLATGIAFVQKDGSVMYFNITSVSGPAFGGPVLN